ncbi:MAG: phosphoribosylglycinamide formyltransferase [Nitrososphaerota archaeon]|nr:phosphoribosylglycinamide formyltransferase [Nitrososphaerales archaeon]MDW8044673.1 phosphoribosylglycinamide formyltransferase [Nitrososphaerota archaeon]
MVVNIGILVSGRGSNMEAILKAVKEGRIKNCEVKVVISSRKDARALEIAKAYGVKALAIEEVGFKDRVEYDREIIKHLIEHGVTPENGLVLLAGYMKILSQEFVNKFRWRIMNIHPSLLPSFPGLHAQKQALEYGVKVSGCTVHFVDENLDAGPIILQASVPVKEDDTVESLSNRILELEHRLYPEAVRLFVEGKLRIEGRRVRILE